MMGIHTCSTIKKNMPSSPSLMMDSPYLSYVDDIRVYIYIYVCVCVCVRVYVRVCV